LLPPLREGRRGGRLWPRLSERTLNCDFGFPVKMVIEIRMWPSTPDPERRSRGGAEPPDAGQFQSKDIKDGLFIMDKHEDNAVFRAKNLRMLWIIFGCILGAISGLAINISQGHVLFVGSGGIDFVFPIVSMGFFGLFITQRCKPTRKSLIGALIFPIFMIACFQLFSTSIESLKNILIGIIPISILSGILIGTYWFGGIIGILILAIIIIFIAPIIRGSIGWGWIFIPMGSISGALIQLAILEIKEERITNRSEMPKWLKDK
jgi:hypothetical protein